jgi:hypothetical protein
MRFKCDNCNRKFKEKRTLVQHQNKKIPCTVMYGCDKCDYVFKTQRELTRHENRKTSCAPTEVPVISEDNPENKCHYCNKTYANKQNLVRHLKICDKDSNMRIIMEKLTNLENQINKQNGTTINVSNNTSQNLYVNSTPCLFGEEDFTLLDQTKVQTMFLEDPRNFVPRLLCELHNNPDLPQFHNVYYEPKTQKTMIFTRVLINGIYVNTWQLKELEDVSVQLVTKAKRYPTCMPLAQNIKPNSFDEQRYCQSLEIVTRQYEHSEADLISTKEMLTNVTKNPGFFKMLADTTYVSGSLPLIHLN